MDLDRTTGIIYGLKGKASGRIFRVDYMEAHSAWMEGRTVYTKNGSGYRREVHARPWQEHPPHPGKKA